MVIQNPPEQEWLIPLSAECADVNSDSSESMKSLNALAACVWPSLGWEWQRLCVTSGWLPSAWQPWYMYSSMDIFKRRGGKKVTMHLHGWG